MTVTLATLALAALLFVRGKVRPDLVAVCAMLSLMLFGVLTPAEALSGFSDSVIVMMAGLFVVGGGILRTGLAKMIGGRIMKLAGKSPAKLFLLTILATAGIGAFVSNTGTVALMLPIIVSMAMDDGLPPRRLLMPMAFASSIGGMTTMIGTFPNIIVASQLTDAGYHELGFFSFTPSGLVCVATGILALIPLSRRYLSSSPSKPSAPQGKTIFNLIDEYKILDHLYRLKLDEQSSLAGKTLDELDISERYGINVVEIRRKTSPRHGFLKTVHESMAHSDTKLREGDVLYVMGDFGDIETFSNQSRTALIDRRTAERVDGNPTGILCFNTIGMAEMLLMPNSELVNMPVRSCGLREDYGVNILAIQRQGKYILQDLHDEKIRSGDTLLIQGHWSDIERMSKRTFEWVIVGRPWAEASKVTLTAKAPLAAAIMILMIAAMATGIVPSVTAVLVAAVLMVLTGCLRNVGEAYKTINWESIILIAAMMPMAAAMEKTGLSTAISGALVTGLGNFGPWVLMAGLYVAGSLLTLFLSNTATTILLAPIALQSAAGMNASPYAFLLAVSISTSMCFASPFSTPANSLVMTAGHYTFMDYVRVGGPLQIIMGIVMIAVLPLFFPFH